MGLDMYAYSLKADALGEAQGNFNLNKLQEQPEAEFNSNLAYWRKFNHLHGWMEDLYIAKGGTKTFNCETLRLMPTDIDQLEADLAANRLSYTAGFFFGGEEIYPNDIEALKQFITDARAEFAQGRAVIYDSWW